EWAGSRRRGPPSAARAWPDYRGSLPLVRRPVVHAPWSAARRPPLRNPHIATKLSRLSSTGRVLGAIAHKSRHVGHGTGCFCANWGVAPPGVAAVHPPSIRRPSAPPRQGPAVPVPVPPPAAPPTPPAAAASGEFSETIRQP